MPNRIKTLWDGFLAQHKNPLIDLTQNKPAIIEEQWYEENKKGFSGKEYGISSEMMEKLNTIFCFGSS